MLWRVDDRAEALEWQLAATEAFCGSFVALVIGILCCAPRGTLEGLVNFIGHLFRPRMAMTALDLSKSRWMASFMVLAMVFMCRGAFFLLLPTDCYTEVLFHSEKANQEFLVATMTTVLAAVMGPQALVSKPFSFLAHRARRCPRPPRHLTRPGVRVQARPALQAIPAQVPNPNPVVPPAHNAPQANANPL